MNSNFNILYEKVAVIFETWIFFLFRQILAIFCRDYSCEHEIGLENFLSSKTKPVENNTTPQLLLVISCCLRFMALLWPFLIDRFISFCWSVGTSLFSQPQLDFPWLGYATQPAKLRQKGSPMMLSPATKMSPMPSPAKKMSPMPSPARKMSPMMSPARKMSPMMSPAKSVEMEEKSMVSWLFDSFFKTGATFIGVT